MQQSYHLPYLTLVEVLSPFPEELLAQARLPALPAISKGAVLAQVLLGHGQPLRSRLVLEDHEPLLLSKPHVQEILLHCGELDWQVRSLAPARAASLPREQGPHAMSPAAVVPSLRVPLSTPLLISLPHPERRLLALVDGRRSIADLARLLSKTPQEVHHALHHLDAFIDR